MGGLRQEMRELRDGLRQEMNELREDLGHQMRVLHEDTIDKIRALAPDYTMIRREFTASDDQVREDVDRRLTPLETLARNARPPG
jgi:hypothetical protein